MTSSNNNNTNKPIESEQYQVKLIERKDEQRGKIIHYIQRGVRMMKKKIRDSFDCLPISSSSSSSKIEPSIYRERYPSQSRCITTPS